MARKQKHEEHENHERWLVSYADFITLLFAFFVVMYSVSSVNEGKYRVLSDALLAAFRSQPKTLLPIQEGQPAKSPLKEDMNSKSSPALVSAPDLPVPSVSRKKKYNGQPAPLGEVATRLEQEFDRLIDEDIIAIRYNDNYVEIELKSNILFPAASTQLTPKATEVLTKLGKILRNFPNVVRVEGYTDDNAMNSTIYPSNWELSAARAGSVVRLFMENGVDPARMSAVGYAQYRPLADNSTPEGRIQNRRVTVVVLNQADTFEFREDIYMASISKDGRASVVAADGEAGWKPPVDVTRSPVTQKDRFVVIDSPLQLSSPVTVKIAPTPDRTDRVPRSQFVDKQGGSQ